MFAWPKHGLALLMLVVGSELFLPPETCSFSAPFLAAAVLRAAGELAQASADPTQAQGWVLPHGVAALRLQSS